MMWFLSNLKLLGIGFSLVILFGTGAYIKGRVDGKASYRLAIEREISDAVKRGQKGRADALRKFDNGRLHNDWFLD